MTSSRETLLHYLGLHKLRIATGVLLVAASAFVAVLPPLFIGRIVDALTAGSTMDTVVQLSLLIVLLAAAENVLFLDLHEVIASRYDSMGEAAVTPLFADVRVHTTRAGAELSARCVVDALRALPQNPLAQSASRSHASPAGAAMMQMPSKPG